MNKIIEAAMKETSKNGRTQKSVRNGKIKPKIQKWHPVEMAGIWMLLNKPFYEGKDVLNADYVGEENARRNAELAAKAPQLQAENKKLREILYQCEIFIGQELSKKEYYGVWRDDEKLILKNVKRALAQNEW